MTVGRQRTAFHFPNGTSFVPLFYVDEQADIFPVAAYASAFPAACRSERFRSRPVIVAVAGREEVS
jgi:hypothetical protein